jgi:pyrroloquinoline quinone (PQQ) biosynthesis protein C
MDKQFELALRKHIDTKFRRVPKPDNAILHLIEGSLSPEDFRAYFRGMWESLMVFNRVLLSRLIERAPTLPVRCELVEIVNPEFGRNLRDAHPLYFKNFLEALGVPSRELAWDIDMERGPWVEEIRCMRSWTWPELLGRILCGEAIGPVSFKAVARACQKYHALPDYAVAYFNIHSIHDKKDTEILFNLAARTVITEEAQASLLHIVDWSFDRGRYLDYGCNLPDTEPESYQYAPLFEPASKATLEVA